MQNTVQRVPSKSTASTGTPGTRSVTTRPPGDASDPLATYFRDVAQHSVMNREDELATANAIATQRAALWQALLDYPAQVSAICRLVRELVPTEAVQPATITAIEKAAEAVLRRDSGSQRLAFAAARKVMVLALAEFDVDAVVSDRAFAELARTTGEGVALAQHRAAVEAARSRLAATRQRFVRANLRLVVMVARRFNHGRLALHDLIQEGNIGLMKAVDRFDPRRGFRFSTYATWWIRHAISRALADTGRAVRLPVHMIEAQTRVARVRREFEAMHGREPSEAELAEASGLSLERIHRMRWSLVEGPVSLDAPVSRVSTHTLQDLLADAEAAPASDLLDSELLHRRLREAFAALPAMEAAVLRERMGMDDEPEQTLREIGERHALSRERIRQIQEQGLARLRREFRRHDLM